MYRHPLRLFLFSKKCIQTDNCTQLTSTIQACWQSVKGVVRVAGWAVELQAAPRWALDSLSGAMTDSLLWQETGVVVVDKVAEDTAIREGHGEVLHLQTDNTLQLPSSLNLWGLLKKGRIFRAIKISTTIVKLLFVLLCWDRRQGLNCNDVWFFSNREKKSHELIHLHCKLEV